MSLDISLYFIGKFKAGEAGYYRGRPRGRLAVENDGTLYLYQQPQYWARWAVKKAIQAAFCNNGEKITGRWPAYTIK